MWALQSSFGHPPESPVRKQCFRRRCGGQRICPAAEIARFPRSSLAALLFSIFYFLFFIFNLSVSDRFLDPGKRAGQNPDQVEDYASTSGVAASRLRV
jgi:hypothetical protein